MTKAAALVLLLAMLAHLVRPFGLPGLRRRLDFWKIAVFALFAVSAAIVLQHL